MTNHRNDVIERAIDLLDRYGLADLSMRRLAAELGVQPSALYHHFADKQTLLAAVADEVLRRGARPAARAAAVGWETQVRAICAELRDAMLAYRDGAELLATVHAFGLGARAPGLALDAALDETVGVPLRRTAVRTLLHYVFGHTADEQAHLQAAVAGAVSSELRTRSDFELGLSLILDGLRQHVAATIPSDLMLGLSGRAES